MMSEPVVTVIDNLPVCRVGEGPHWDESNKVLYMVDIPNGKLMKYNPKTAEAITNSIGSHASFIIPVKGRKDEFVVGSQLDVLHVKWDTAANKILEKNVLVHIDEQDGNQLNDAKCDAKGRLWFGTLAKGMKNPDGAMYSYSKKGGLVKHQDGVILSNGLGFSLDNKKLYYVDTRKASVAEYAFDLESGTIKFEKNILDFSTMPQSGLPDGMTVDSEGNLWIACFSASKVIQVDPHNGNIIRSIRFDKSPQITSVSFGGDGLNELYVTSANITSSEEFKESSNGPWAGVTYRVTDLKATGLNANQFNFDL